MPRAAGSNSNYTFVLRNDNNGRYIQDVTISLPSVTTIINATVAKPALVGWAYRSTRDSVAGLIDQLLQSDYGSTPEGRQEVLDALTDGDWLDELLKENALRPDDIKEEAGDRGTVAHAHLEDLCSAYFAENGGPEAAWSLAESAPRHPWHVGVSRWWRAASPIPIKSETVLYSLRHRFCGTVDLVWHDIDNNLVITDLKSRGPDRGIYETDHVQVCAYKIAYEEMTGEKVDRTSVLVVREDGTYEEETTSIDPSVFLSVLDVYNLLRR